MKHKICKILLVIFTLCFLYGCDERVPSDVAEVSENKNSETKSEITESIISKADLTQRESFYLQLLVGNEDPVAFDAMWNQDFHSLTYKIYNYENHDWHEVTKGSYELEGKMAWIVVGTNLTELNISIGNGDSRYEKNGETTIKSLGNFSGDQAILQKHEIEKGKEIPVIAYREIGNEESKKADFSDFTNPDQVVMAENENYVMLTFTFE